MIDERDRLAVDAYVAGLKDLTKWRICNMFMRGKSSRCVRKALKLTKQELENLRKEIGDELIAAGVDPSWRDGGSAK